MRIAIAGGTGVVGRYVVDAAAAAGHDVVVLARSTGVDTRSGGGLARALEGVEIVVDATNAGTTEEGPATEFFVASSAHLQKIGAEQGVRHLVVLSIVGIDRVPSGYYGAKLAHERAARLGPVPVTILRATQFHELAAQMIGWNRKGAVAAIPNFHVQSVAARTVAGVLLELAEGVPRERVPDLGGPQVADLVTLARRLADRFHINVEVQALDPGLAPQALLPGSGARIEGPTFDEWLASSDAADVAGLA